MPSNFKVLAGASGEPIDPNFRNVTLLLHGDGNNGGQNNAFVDSSSNHFPISRNGNTTQGSFSPYGSNWSNYFDANGDYLTVSYSSALQFPGDFTIEAWVFPIARLQTYPCIVGNYSTYTSNGGFAIFAGHGSANTSKYQVAFNGSFPVIQSTSDITYNSWQHIALVRSGSTLTLYVNGVANGTATSSATVTGTANNWWVGTAGDVVSGGEFNGYISNLRAVKGTAVYTSNFTPPTQPLTAITNTSLLTCAYNRFRDGSTNNFTMTRNGDVRVTNFAPFAPSSAAVYDQNDVQYWSGAFDGAGDYLTVADNTALQMSGSFTWEAWVYPLTLPGSGYKTLWGQRANAGAYGGPLVAIDTSGNILLFIANDNATGWTVVNFDTGFDISLNTWQHIALVKNGSTITLYKDGVAGSATTHATAVGTSGSLSIMAGTADGSQAVDGYMSNFRIVKGTAVYTSNFTPPTAPLTAISGTSLLTLQSAAFTDNSANKFSITVNGNATVIGNSPYNPVGYWSNYFDGSGDYLTLPSNSVLDVSSGNFTIEAWVYATSSVQLRTIYSNWWDGTSGGVLFALNGTTPAFFWRPYDAASPMITGPAVTLNTWTHVAVVRNGNTFTIYTNGVAGSPISYSTNCVAGEPYIIGAYARGASGNYVGYISNLRVVKGTAVYTSNFTPSTAPLTDISGTSLLTCQANRFIDSSTNAFTITRYGDVSVRDFDPFTSASVTSTGGSAYFDGSGDYLTTTNTNFTGDATVECWLYVNSLANPFQIFGTNNGVSDGRWIGALVATNGALAGGAAAGISSGYSSATGTIKVGQWTHVAWVKTASGVFVYVNGTQVATCSLAQGYAYNATPLYISRLDGTDAYCLNGYISNLRIVNGTAIYTASFTPPASPVTSTTNTSLLLNGQNAAIFDNSMKNDLETVGNAQISTSVKKFGTGSMYFDGSGDAITIPASTELTFGTGDFTMEMWIYSGANGTSTRTMGNGAGASWSANKWVLGTGDATFVNKFIVGCNNATSTSALLSSTTTFNDSTWKHVAITRSGNTWRLFVNGTQEATATSSASLDGGIPATITVGRSGISSDADWAGYIDELRLTKGVARYTANFTAPTAPFPNK